MTPDDTVADPPALTYCSRCGERVGPYKPSGLSLRVAYEWMQTPLEELLTAEPHYWCPRCAEHWLATNLMDTGILCPCGLLVPMHHRYCGGCGREANPR